MSDREGDHSRRLCRTSTIRISDLLSGKLSGGVGVGDNWAAEMQILSGEMPFQIRYM